MQLLLFELCEDSLADVSAIRKGVLGSRGPRLIKNSPPNKNFPPGLIQMLLLLELLLLLLLLLLLPRSLLPQGQQR